MPLPFTLWRSMAAPRIEQACQQRTLLPFVRPLPQTFNGSVESGQRAQFLLRTPSQRMVWLLPISWMSLDEYNLG
jgi:hypothetical protein